eukprot:TRINITY_DN1444_c0_g4_i2.p3 TRINITY_DN1444_c0_g4~~TRINITY_DN1444_c0_g4_i2.p3  ORF type:complete len:131 (-),score=12.01 TRINITY_DN1444_c0_g4_i2:180-572(-)
MTDDDKRFSEFWIVALLSLPYLVDFISGCYTFNLAWHLFELEEKRQRQRGVPTGHEESSSEDDWFDMPEDFDPHGDMCVVCYAQKRTTVVIPCGHMALCQQCANVIGGKWGAKCPICRSLIQEIFPVRNV